MMRKQFSKLFVCLAMFAGSMLVASPSQADWSDGFETYANGTSLAGGGAAVGGWDGWAGSAASAGTAVNTVARTGSNSIRVAGPSGDAVHPFLPGEYSTGVVALEAWMMLNQADHTANTWFIVNNAYVNGGAGTFWATQLQFSSNTGQVSAANGVAGGNGTAPINYNTWTQIRILYDLGNDLQQTYYNGALMSTGPARNGTDPLGVANIDLFQEGTASNIAFYDDLSVTVIPEPTSAGCLAFALCGSLLFRRRKA